MREGVGDAGAHRGQLADRARAQRLASKRPSSKAPRCASCTLLLDPYLLQDKARSSTTHRSRITLLGARPRSTGAGEDYRIDTCASSFITCTHSAPSASVTGVAPHNLQVRPELLRGQSSQDIVSWACVISPFFATHALKTGIAERRSQPSCDRPTRFRSPPAGMPGEWRVHAP